MYRLLPPVSACLLAACALSVPAAAQELDLSAPHAPSTSVAGVTPAAALDGPLPAEPEAAPLPPPHPQPGVHPDDLSQMLDVGDLWRMIRHHQAASATVAAGRRYLVVAPVIGSKPSTGFSGGVSSNVAFLRGDSATTHLSTISGGFRLSQKGQTLAGSRVAVFTGGDQWFILGDNRMAWTSQNAYALGADAPASSGTTLKYDALKLFESAYRCVSRSLFVGGGLNVSSHFHIRPGSAASLAKWNDSAYLGYSTLHHLSVDHQDSGGASVGVRYDSRDNGINAARGALVSATYRTFFNGFLGGDTTWQEVSFDARGYKRLTHDARQKLAFWFMGDLVTGGTAPYWDLPSTSADGRSARGYGEGRYRGEQMLYWEAEYRASLMKRQLLGLVLFANVSTFESRETHQRLFESYAPGAGFGFRVLLNKRSRTNLCSDWGWGKQGSRGFYLSIQEAF